MTDTITPPAEGTVTPPAAGTGAGEPWYKGADTETLGYIQNRGLDKKPVNEVVFEAIKAHRSAEAKLGIPADQILRMPKDASDEQGFKSLYEKLGVPAKAEDYDMKPVIEAGASADYAAFIQKTALERHMSKADGEAFARDLVKFAGEKAKADEADTAAKISLERDGLKKDWGFNFTANLAIARSAAQKLGIPAEAIAALENVAGYRATMGALQKIGVAIGEAKFVTSEVTGGILTKEGAVSRKAELMRDTAWSAKYLNGDTAAVREMTNLNTIITASQ